MHDPIKRLHTVLLGGFVLVALTLGYWQFFRRDELIARPTNPRLAEEARRVVRGRILDRNGVVLAESRQTPDGTDRTYNHPGLAHVTGYHSFRYGATSIEARYDEYLRGARSADPLERLRASLLHRPTVGSDVVLTVDARIQEAALQAMGRDAGAIIALDPRTGAVLALASQPYYDPNAIDEAWEGLSRDRGQPLFNRATQAAYTPGSTFKLVTAAAAIDSLPINLDQKFRCTTQMDLGGLKVDCQNHPHLAQVSYREAFAWSCNRTFALTGLELGYGRLQLADDIRRPLEWERSGIRPSVERLEEYAGRFGFGKEIPFELPVTVSRLKGDGDWYPSLLGQTAFGQGELQATPLLMALSAAAIANGGVLPAPYLATEARAPNGTASTLNGPGALGRVVKSETAAALSEMMVLSVEVAYAQKAKIPGVKVAGKTGTAETGPAGAQPHSWFIGYAPADNPRVAVAVVLENRGSGSDFATPAAQRILQAALDLYKPAGR
jgi:penicillin-binding protein A